MKNAVSRWALAILVGSCLFCSGIFLLWSFANFIHLSPQIIYWLQVVSGNWSPSPVPVEEITGRHQEIVVGSAIAVILNLGTIFAAVGAIVGFFVLRREVRAMRFTAVITDRDRVIKRKILEALGGLEGDRYFDAVNMAFRAGVEEWNTTYKENMLTDDQRMAIDAILEKNIAQND